MKIWKKLGCGRVMFGLLLVVCLLAVLLLPGGSMKTEAATQNYDIWVCGTKVTSENRSGNGWSYEPETNTLTLNNFNWSYTPTISDAAIYSGQALNLVLEGTNKVENNSKDGNQQMGIMVRGTLTISGEGSLEVQGESDAVCYGIYVSGKLVINGGSIVAIGKNSGAGVGIYATGDIGDITINGGSVSATGNKGIFCGGTYEQNGGDVMTISNNDNTNRYGTGLYAKKAITITSGKLRAIGSQNENSKKSFGIECDGIYTQTDGKVEATSNNLYAGSDGERIGLKAAGIKFEGDTLTLEGNTRAYKITGRSDSEQTNEKNITWTKASVLKASDFTITQPDGIYNGKEQEFTVTPKAGINCGAVTVKYYRYNKNNGTYASMYSRKPTALGDYKFELNVTGSSSYAATTLQDESWKFTIGYGTLTDDLYTMEGLVESNGKKWAKGNVLVSAADGYQLTNVENKNYKDALNFPSGYHEIWIKDNPTGKVYTGTINLDFTLDQEGPVINGLENEKTYYNQDVTFNVTDEGSGVEKVTATQKNSNVTKDLTAESADTYKLAEINGWYTISVYDKLGNSRSIEVCVVSCEHNSNYFGTVSYDWKKDATGRIISCTASTICSSCKQEVKETVTVDAGITETIVQKQSCTKPELITYTAKFERDGFQNQVKERVETAPASHKLQKVNAKAATCTDEGNIEYYKCSECGLCFKNSDGTEPLTEDATKIAKKYHEGAEPVVYTWNEKHTTCTAVIKCKNCDKVIYKAEGIISSETTKEANCTEEGEITYTAAFPKGSAYKDQTEKVTVAALGHVEPEDDGDCTTEVICERCKAVIKDAKAHDWSDSWTKDASGHWHACQNDGCTKKEDEAAHTPDIPMPTDDTDQKCTVCEYIIAPKKSHEHTLQKIEATEATCTTPGKQEYYKCETCGHFFADEAATKEVMEGDMIIPARGHDYANLVYTWSEDYTTCTAVQKCNNCDTVNATEKVSSTSSVTQSQSCTAPELTTYTATFTSETFAVQKKVVQTKEAAGHMPGDWIVDRLATVTEEGSRHKECSVCKAIVKTEIIEKLPYISSDTTKPDSTKEEPVTKKIEINAAGKSVSVTTTVRKDASGKVISTVQTKEIVDAAKDTSVTVTSVTDGEGKTSMKAEVVKTGTKSAAGTKGTISSDVVAQITEAAGTTDVVITQKVVDQNGKTAYTVSVNAKDLTSGEKFVVVKYNKKTGKYTLCNKKTYKVTDAGVSLTVKDSGSYQLISEADAAKLVKEILATVKPAKESKTVKEGNAASFAWSKELDTANVSKITYSSTDNSIAKIGKNGKITAKKAGKVTLKATVTLKNGKKKVVSMKFSVRSK